MWDLLQKYGMCRIILDGANRTMRNEFSGFDFPCGCRLGACRTGRRNNDAAGARLRAPAQSHLVGRGAWRLPEFKATTRPAPHAVTRHATRAQSHVSGKFGCLVTSINRRDVWGHIPTACRIIGRP